jgi:hypothetical protein
MFGAAALLLVVQACGAPPGLSAAPSPTAVHSPSAQPTPTLIPSPSPSPTPPPAKPEPAPVVPASRPVAFYGLPAGTYPVHLHSVCSGAQNFHVTVVQSLSVSGGSGSIQVPSSYFGRGLCVIVYSSNALSRVLTTRSI